MKYIHNQEQSPPQSSEFNIYAFLTNNIIHILKMLKNIVVLFVIILLFLSPVSNKLTVKILPSLYSSSSSQLFKWLGLILKALIISILYNIIYIFV